MFNAAQFIKIILLGALIFTVSTKNSFAEDYQWKFFFSNMNDRQTAVKIFEKLYSLPSIEDVNINFEQQTAVFYLDDLSIDEDIVKKALEDAGYQVRRMMVLQEPNMLGS